MYCNFQGIPQQECTQPLECCLPLVLSLSKNFFLSAEPPLGRAEEGRRCLALRRFLPEGGRDEGWWFVVFLSRERSQRNACLAQGKKSESFCWNRFETPFNVPNSDKPPWSTSSNWWQNSRILKLPEVCNGSKTASRWHGTRCMWNKGTAVNVPRSAAQRECGTAPSMIFFDNVRVIVRMR